MAPGDSVSSPDPSGGAGQQPAGGAGGQQQPGGTGNGPQQSGLQTPVNPAQFTIMTPQVIASLMTQAQEVASISAQKQVEAMTRMHNATLDKLQQSQDVAQKNHVSAMQQLEEQHKAELKQQREEAEKARADMLAKQAEDTKAHKEMVNKMQQPPKFNIGKLKSKARYHTWLYKLTGEMAGKKIDTVVKDLVDGKIATTDLTELEDKKVTALASEVRASLEEDALSICSSLRANDIAALLKALKNWAGKLSEPEMDALNKDFQTSKWDPKKKTLAVWIADKFNDCLRLEEMIPEPTRERHMRSAILNNLPSYFGKPVNDLRANTYGD